MTIKPLSSLLSCFGCTNPAVDDQQDRTPGRRREGSARNYPLDGLRRRKAPDDAEVTIQKHWRGAAQRDHNAREAAGTTPYPNEFHYKMAMNGYSQKAKDHEVDHPGSLATEWSAYESTSGLSAERPALLSSHQRRGAVEDAISTIYGNTAPKGAEYQPNGIHTMRSNSAWLLGLAHHGVPAVLTTPVERQTVMRYDLNSTALARELTGMLQSGHFEAGAPLGPWQTLAPTASAPSARLVDFRTPPAMPLESVKAILDEANIDTSRLE